MPTEVSPKNDIALTLLDLGEQIGNLTKLLKSQRPKPLKLSRVELETGFYLTAKTNGSTLCIPASEAAKSGAKVVHSIEAFPSGSLLVTMAEGGEQWFVAPAMVRKGLILTEEK
jgi:hypothetical protein